MKKSIFTLIIVSPLLLNAQGFQVNLQGQRQQGMGGAATALTGDGASMFFNPGAVSFLEKNSFSAGTSAVIANTQFTDKSSSLVSKSNTTPGLPFTGYLVMGDKKFKYGLAAYTPFGSSINWQDGWTGRFVVTSVKLNTAYFQPTVSYRLSEKLGIGAGFVYGIGSLGLQSDLPIPGEDDDYSSLRLSGKGRGYGFNTGLLYQPSKHLSFGINYRSSLKLRFKEGNADFNVPANMSSSFPSGPFSTTIHLPSVLSFGTAYKPSQKTTLALEATMVGWKAYDTLRYDFKNNTPAVSDIKLSRNYRNSLSFRLGAEYALTAKIAGRVGVKYLSTPARDGYVTPEMPDANHLSYSTGFGYKISKKLSADASFTYEHITRTDANPEVQLNGTYRSNLFIPGLSINYIF